MKPMPVALILFLGAAPLFSAFEGFPKPSDIFMRTLAVRVSNQTGPWDTRHAVSNFGVSRLEWVYWQDSDRDRALISELKARVRFGGSLNPTQAPPPGWAPFCRTLDGATATVPWLRVYKNDRTNQCVNHPQTLASLSNHIATQIRLGIRAFQVDDVAMNVDVVRSAGGCFCGHCVAGFSKFLAENGKLPAYRKSGWGDGKAFDIKEFLEGAGVKSGDATWNDPKFPAEMKKDFEAFQMASVRAFLPRLQKTAADLAGGAVSFSKNTDAEWLLDRLDYAMYELPWGNASPSAIHRFVAHHRVLGSTVVFDGPKKYPLDDVDLPVLRSAFATAYAAGGYAFVPWDMFTAPAKPRYFARGEDLGDLTAFIRACAPLLDGYTNILAPWDDTAASGELAVSLAGEGRMAAFPHLPAAKPGQEAVIHLVQWEKGRGPVRLQLDPEALLSKPDSAVRVTLFEPVAFDAQAVGRAWASGDYSALKKSRVLLEGAVQPVEVPAGTWSLLKVESLPQAAPLSAPRFFPFGGRVLGDVSVKARAGAGMKIVYTTDGSDPKAGSKAMPDALRLEPAPGARITLKARAVDGAKLSPLAEAVFIGETVLKAVAAPNGAKPGTRYDYYEGQWASMPDWEALTPLKSGVVEFFHQGPRPVETKAWAGRFRAFLNVPTSGRYQFWGFFNAEQGLLRLTVGGQEVFTAKTGGAQGRGELVLAQGYHPVTAEVVESHGDGGKGSHYFFVGFSGPGVPETRITDKHLVCDPSN